MRVMFALFLFAAFLSSSAFAKYPEPSVYPISWQLDFKHGTPHRIVVNSVAYWYMTYTVTNNTGQEQIWAPRFEMMTSDGRIIRSDHDIPAEVFDRIKQIEKIRFLESPTHASGPLHQGPDQAKDSVAIWKEPNPRMGEFKIFAGNLSGEFAILKDDQGKEMKNADGQPEMVRKTLEMSYAVYGDEFYPEQHEVHSLGEKWVMR